MRKVYRDRLREVEDRTSRLVMRLTELESHQAVRLTTLEARIRELRGLLDDRGADVAALVSVVRGDSRVYPKPPKAKTTRA